MTKKITAIALLAVMVLQLTACGKKDKEEVSSTEETSSIVSESPEVKETADTVDTPDILETLDTPDFSQREEVISPYEYPYEPDDLKEELIDYGSSIGLSFNGTLTMKTATSVTKCETRSAVNGTVLETWCKSEIDDIATFAKSSNIPLPDVEFNIMVVNSAKYDGEYIITIYSSSK